MNHVIRKNLTVQQTEEYINKCKGLEPKPKHQLKPHVRGYSRNQLLAVNTIKKAIEMSKKIGIQFSVQEMETENDRRIIISFPKED